MDDETYRKARIRAAERDTSVSALVSEFLRSLAAADSDFERRKKLQDDILATLGTFSAGDRLGRDAVHDRDALR